MLRRIVIACAIRAAALQERAALEMMTIDQEIIVSV